MLTATAQPKVDHGRSDKLDTLSTLDALGSEYQHNHTSSAQSVFSRYASASLSADKEQADKDTKFSNVQRGRDHAGLNWSSGRSSPTAAMLFGQNQAAVDEHAPALSFPVSSGCVYCVYVLCLM